MERKIFRAVGMISGTSIDGIDTSLIETDGYDFVHPIAFMPYSYGAAFREKLRSVLGKRAGTSDPVVAEVERELTELHATLVKEFIAEKKMNADEVDFIGFHGQTIWHNPAAKETIQIGDGDLLANLTCIPVINDFRTADVKAGGHGAPLVPLYHRALAAALPKPVGIINIGGVSNITWIGTGPNDILAFDMGPGNALLDDWILCHTGKPYDALGQLAASGKADTDAVAQFLQNSFFMMPPPKSLDRDVFQKYVPQNLNAADGAATLTLVTVWSMVRGLDFLPQKPVKLYLTGGGRYNLTMMKWLEELSGIPTASVDELAWSGDGLEAEAFGYLAARSHLGLPLSLPSTTGVDTPMTGGCLHLPQGYANRKVAV